MTNIENLESNGFLNFMILALENFLIGFFDQREYQYFHLHCTSLLPDPPNFLNCVFLRLS